TRDNVCVYRRKGKDCLRSASSLDGHRVKTSPAFRETMRWAGRLKAASKAASVVYSLLPARRRKFDFYRRLTGQAMRLFKEGKREKEVLAALIVFAAVQSRRNKLSQTRQPTAKLASDNCQSRYRQTMLYAMCHFTLYVDRGGKLFSVNQNAYAPRSPA
ncbi:MAG: hypothetical protein JST39_14040, partial [Bacteroidetes bacterium]|nr:hypothetical protein [Bacteroidota bacterium]